MTKCKHQQTDVDGNTHCAKENVADITASWKVIDYEVKYNNAKKELDSLRAQIVEDLRHIQRNECQCDWPFAIKQLINKYQQQTQEQ